MKKLKGRYTALIIEGVIFVIWNILVWTLADLEKANVFFYCGYGFTFLAFLLTAGVMFFMKINKNVIFSVLTTAYAVSACYFLITFVMNIIYMSISKGTNAKAVVIPNVIVLLIYVAAMAVAYFAVSHIGGNNKVIDQKVAKLKATAVEIGQIAAIAQDGEIKKSLLELREAVDYSDPLGVDGTASLEEDFSKKVSEVRMLIEGNYETELIASKIFAAKNKLNERNELLRSLK